MQTNAIKQLVNRFNGLKCQKCHILAICQRTFVMSRYGNMGVKRSVRTLGMQTNGIKQIMHWFIGLKSQNTEFQIFPLYFLIFPLYI